MSQETRAQYEQRIARYIAKGVSGGKDNNPDRYALVQLTGSLETDENAINLLADKGYRFDAAFGSYVLMGNYKENN